jgi:Fe-Mn family superoxide dismutase
MNRKEGRGHHHRKVLRPGRLVAGAGLLMALLLVLTIPAPMDSVAQPAAGKPHFQKQPLPYPENTLEPYMSARTISFHYGKHHQGYVNNLNRLTSGTPYAEWSLEEVIKETSGRPDKAATFNNAAQVWNHDFFWQCMKKGGGGKPAAGKLLQKIEASFGSFEEFRNAFKAAAASLFGSGYTWLVQEGDVLKIIQTSNADTPIAHGQTPLLTCDVWEHTYYLDYQNRRPDFVQVFLDHLVNWKFVESKMK